MPERAHQFSPVTNSNRLRIATEYIARNSLALARTVLGRELKIDTICFFTHSPEEYAYLKGAIHARGPLSKFSHGPTTYVDSSFSVLGQDIKIFGVRSPDPTRPWMGYADYPVADYSQICELARDNPNMKEITSGRGKSLIELSHPNFDVLGFVVDEHDHK